MQSSFTLISITISTAIRGNGSGQGGTNLILPDPDWNVKENNQILGLCELI